MKLLLFLLGLLATLAALPWLVYWFAIFRVAMHDIQDKDGE